MRSLTPSKGRFRGRSRDRFLKSRANRSTLTSERLRATRRCATTVCHAEGVAMTDTAIAAAIPETLASVPSSPALDAALIASPDRFFNRELSWLAFNERVMEESENP